MAEGGFSDADSAKAWFERQSPETRSAMSCRGALRVFPSFSQEEGTPFEKLALTSFRCVLIAAGRGLGRAGDIEWLKNAACSAAASTDSVSLSAAYSALSAGSAARAADSPSFSAESAARVVMAADLSTDAAALSAAYSSDAAYSPMDMLVLPLWPEGEVPGVLRAMHSHFLNMLAADEDWAFFRRFYAEIWEGTFTDWDLAIAVATLDPELWEGEDALSKVAGAIRGIEARRRLETEMSALRAELTKLKAVPAVGHNQGPPLEDEDIAVRQSLELIWPILDELEHEVEKDEPNPETLKRLAKAFWQIAKTIAVYCGGKIDVALEKAAETVAESGTKWAVRTVAATYVGSNQSVQSVAIAAWKYALTLLS